MLLDNSFEIPSISTALDERLRESDLISSVSSLNISILHLNIRGFTSHQKELEARIELMTSSPTIVCLNETFLDQSFRSIFLDGYTLVSRRDRQDNSSWGSIYCFALDDFASSIVLVGTSETAERQDHILHTSCAPLVLINQYRPPHYGEVESIQSLYEDMAIYGRDEISTCTTSSG